MFGVPERAQFYCCIPMGYPRGRFGTTRATADFGDDVLGPLEGARRHGLATEPGAVTRTPRGAFSEVVAAGGHRPTSSISVSRGRREAWPRRDAAIEWMTDVDDTGSLLECDPRACRRKHARHQCHPASQVEFWCQSSPIIDIASCSTYQNINATDAKSSRGRGDISVVVVMVDDVRRVVQDGGTGEDDHAHGEERPERQPVDDVHDDHAEHAHAPATSGCFRGN